jgi:hypothetical protein
MAGHGCISRHMETWLFMARSEEMGNQLPPDWKGRPLMKNQYAVPRRNPKHDFQMELFHEQCQNTA